MSSLPKPIRKLLEASEDKLLAPFAAKSGQSFGRRYPEKEHDFRTAFQRDRDRIVHSTAFRRLEYKTQVFVNHEGDHYRTRLTHTLEAAQIGRTVARCLGLNEDLTETIILAHDLGHGPFGHAGEDALRDLMVQHGGFEHNQQSLRIVEVLEDSYQEFPGLNLTLETRIGMQKHSDKKVKGYHVESRIADLSDEIAYDCHDLDDGLRSGLLKPDELEDVRLWKSAMDYISRKYPRIKETQRNRLGVRLVTNRLVSDMIAQTQKNIARYKINSLKDLFRVASPIAGFSSEVRKDKIELQDYLSIHLYQNQRVIRMTNKGKRFLREIFKVYKDCPEQLPAQVQERGKKDGIYRAICDYISGMTDRFALEEYKRLFEPFERV
ncbi:MAG: deoxyguanosinetriphosphate triphosphohydrolase [Candidatus Omnitrophica bacterium]|nr:deoxyguanosinetriphosphate triphosphohydrolase [Candidatus Omnitrophota bacterium]